MTWKAYEIKLISKSPIYIGFKKLGVVAQTRYYIPAKNLWASLTAYVTRIEKEKPQPNDYIRKGEELDKNIKFSYFYPFDNHDILYPQYTDKGVKYGNLGMEEFEGKYISSFVNTSLDRKAGTALEEIEGGKGSLHEVEFIKGKTNFIGYCFLKDDFMDINDLKKILLFLKYEGIGGERNYGFGKLELISIKELAEYKTIFGVLDFDGSKTWPELNSQNGLMLHILGHMKIENGMMDDFNEIKGEVESIVGREWSSKKGSGQGLRFDGIYFVPGTVVRICTSSKIAIDRQGFWKLLK